MQTYSLLIVVLHWQRSSTMERPEPQLPLQHFPSKLQRPTNPLPPSRLLSVIGNRLSYKNNRHTCHCTPAIRGPVPESTVALSHLNPKLPFSHQVTRMFLPFIQISNSETRGSLENTRQHTGYPSPYPNQQIEPPLPCARIL